MVITLESSIIHILNTAEDYPVLSEQPLLLEPTAKEYLIKTLEKTLSSDDVKNCFFRSESSTWEQCKNVSWDLVSVSQSIAKEVFVMVRLQKNAGDAPSPARDDPSPARVEKKLSLSGVPIKRIAAFNRLPFSSKSNVGYVSAIEN